MCDLLLETRVEKGVKAVKVSADPEPDAMCPSEPQSPTIIRFANVSMGTGTGDSWANARLLNAVNTGALVAGQEGWVKEGTYNITISLSLQAGAALYGGFKGTENSRSERNKVDLVVNQLSSLGTIISFAANNLSAVVTNGASPSTGSYVIDGFQFTSVLGFSGGRGFDTASATSQVGPVFRNCRFHGFNGSSTNVMFGNVGISRLITVCNVLIENNVIGRIFLSSNGSLLKINCLIRNNNILVEVLQSSGTGAGQSNITMINVIVIANSRNIYSIGLPSIAYVINCTFSSPTITPAANILVLGATSQLFIYNSIIQGATGGGNRDVSTSTGATIVAQNNLIVFFTGFVPASPVLPAVAVPLDGNYYPLPGSTVINAGQNAILSGPIPLFTGSVTTDVYGNNRIFNGTVDVGATEFDSKPSGTLDQTNTLLCFYLDIQNCSNVPIRKAHVEFNIENSILDKDSCDFVYPVSPSTIATTIGTPNNNWDGVIENNIIENEITLLPGTSTFSVSTTFVDTNIGAYFPIWSITGQGECNPIHQSIVTSTDCLPEDAYLP